MSAPAPPLCLTRAQREQLEAWAQSPGLPPRQRLRARIVLMAAAGTANQAIAERLGTSKPTVLKWRARFESDGPEGLTDADGRGPRVRYGPEFMGTVIDIASGLPPDGRARWSIRSLARQVGASPATVHRILWHVGLGTLWPLPRWIPTVDTNPGRLGASRLDPRPVARIPARPFAPPSDPLLWD